MESKPRKSFKKKAWYGILFAAGAGALWVGVHDAPYLLACKAPLSPVSYHKIVDVGEDRYMVRDGEDGLWGMIDREGRVIIPPRYNWFIDESDLWRFSDNRLPVGMVEEGAAQWFDPQTGETVKDANQEWTWQRMGYIDRDGHEAIPLKWNESAHPFREGSAYVSNNKWVRIGTHPWGEPDIEPESESYRIDADGKRLPWHERIAENRFSVFRDGQSYLTDEQGNTLSAGYAQIYPSRSNRYADGRLLRVRLGGDAYGLINAEDGREVLAPRYREIFEAGDYWIGFIMGTGVLVFDGHGNVVFEQEAQDMEPSPCGKTIFLQSGGQWQVYDMAGNRIAALAPGMAWAGNVSCDLTRIAQNGLFGLADRQGNIVQAPRFAEIGGLSEDRMAFKENGKYGFFDDTGRIAVPAQYTEAKAFRGGMSAVHTGTHWQIIDKTGKVLADRLPHKEIWLIGDQEQVSVVGDWRKPWFGLWGDSKERVVFDLAGEVVPVHHLHTFKHSTDTAVVRIYPGTGGNLGGIPYLIRFRGEGDYLMQEDGCLLPEP